MYRYIILGRNCVSVYSILGIRKKYHVQVHNSSLDAGLNKSKSFKIC